MPEWLKGVDCKSTGVSLHKFESYSAQNCETSMNSKLSIVSEKV